MSVNRKEGISPDRVINKRIAKQFDIPEDSYSTKLKKYIPSDVIIMYVALAGIIREIPEPKEGAWNSQINLFFALLVIGFIFTPLYKGLEIKRDNLENPYFQLIISTLAYVAWVFVLGDWFKLAMCSGYSPQLASAIAIIFTASIPLIEGYLIKPKPGDQ